MKKITRLNALLTALGFTPDPNENVSLLKWALEQAENYAKLQLNLPLIPAEAEKPLLNIAAGEYLRAKNTVPDKESIPLTAFPAVKRLELGDTKTEFDTDNFTTPEQRFDLLTEYLITSGKAQLEGYRKLKW